MAKHQKKKKKKKKEEFGGSEKSQKSSDDYQKSMETLSRNRAETQWKEALILYFLHMLLKRSWSEHFTPFFKSLYWIPLLYPVQPKVLVLPFHAVHSLALSCLSLSPMIKHPPLQPPTLNSTIHHPTSYIFLLTPRSSEPGGDPTINIHPASLFPCFKALL